MKTWRRVATSFWPVRGKTATMHEERRPKPPPPALLLDTTLRDGEQAPGVVLTPAEKAEYVRRAEDVGIRYIEIGFPQNALDLEACEAAANAAKSSRLVAMALATAEGVDKVHRIGAHEILFVVPCSSSHLNSVYGRDARILISHVLECAELAASRNLSVNIGLEDAGHRDMDAIYRTLDGLSSLGSIVECITVPDTRGQLLPAEAVELLADIRGRLPNPSCRLAFHAHNDLGLATANSLAALQMNPPVDCVHVTTCGFGERAGNASLEQLATLIMLKLGQPDLLDLNKIKTLADYVSRIFLTPLSFHAPIIGSKVFLHESGLHQRGMLKDGRSYQYLDPTQFGRRAGLVLGKHSGKSFRQWIADCAECEERKVLKLQELISKSDKEGAKEKLAQALEEISRISLFGLEEEEAIRQVKPARGKIN
jgi:isopropylmalate/homocitrate/citramalate synthase